jgi:outer membrane protein
MIRKLTILTLALALAGAAFAQTPSAPSATQQQQRPAAQPGPQTAAPAGPAGTKLGVINIEQAILMTNEGQRDFGTLQKKFEPKRTELENLNKELETMRNDLNAQGDKLNEQARAARTQQIERKQKDFQRNYEDAQQDFQAQQTEVVNRIGEKMLGVIDTYAKGNGYAVIMDVSRPQTPVLWVGPTINITKEIVDAYNTVSGVPAPPRPATTGAGAQQGGTQPARPAQQPQRPATQQPR